jgi:hypothetical protein
MRRIAIIAVALFAAFVTNRAEATGSADVMTHVQCSQIAGHCTHTEITFVWGLDAAGNWVMVIISTRTWQTPYRRLQ